MIVIPWVFYKPFFFSQLAFLSLRHMQKNAELWFVEKKNCGAFFFYFSLREGLGVDIICQKSKLKNCLSNLKSCMRCRCARQWYRYDRLSSTVLYLCDQSIGGGQKGFQSIEIYHLVKDIKKQKSYPPSSPLWKKKLLGKKNSTTGEL